jgi:hypothetical protein
VTEARDFAAQVHQIWDGTFTDPAKDHPMSETTTEAGPPKSWKDIAPKDALDIDCTKRPDLNPPVNEAGEVCPWPWEPQQLAGAPLGQMHCSYCGAMCMAGLEHPDWSDYDELRAAELAEGSPS